MSDVESINMHDLHVEAEKFAIEPARMGAFLSCLFFRNLVTTVHESHSATEDGLCGQKESEHAQLFDCAFISGVCQDQVEKRMITFTRDQYPAEVIFSTLTYLSTRKKAVVCKEPFRRKPNKSPSVSPPDRHRRAVFSRFGAVEENTNTKSGMSVWMTFRFTVNTRCLVRFRARCT